MSAEVKTVEMYDDFLLDEEIVDFETDMEEMNYSKWVDKYPNHVLIIFGAILSSSGSEITEKDIVYFIEKGINLNVSSNAYHSDAGGTTPLGSACEFRMDEIIKYLCKHGANVDLEDQHGFTPLESVLMGHGANNMYDVEDVETCVKILVEAGVKNEVQGYIILEFCTEYSSSDYLKNFLLESKDRTPTVKE